MAARSLVWRLHADHPLRVPVFRHFDVMLWHQIVPGLDPSARIAAFAKVALGAMAGEINLAVPLAMPRTIRAKRIQIAAPGLHRDAIKGMGVIRAGAQDDAFFMRHGAKPRGRAGPWQWELQTRPLCV